MLNTNNIVFFKQFAEKISHEVFDNFDKSIMRLRFRHGGEKITNLC